ncbi:MAG: NFACT RNA binding domain-containing protein [Lachnospiraceae bacterium]|nr:NFACT RNA binding domain-containing protein [Lachnospiraceae bacterium]
MALDGISISALVHELNQKLSGGRFFKIAQPETDELQITVKQAREQYKLLISASASLPLTYITENSKTSPLTAPNFCMVLRKHLSNAKILEITQPGLERIIHFKMEHYNEMGDLCQKLLIIELMGKHSNIIFTEPDGKIIDSIKHISANVSSVREVLPGRTYFIPDTAHKANPLEINCEDFCHLIGSKPMGCAKAIYTSLTGISPLAAQDICYRADIDGDKPANVLAENELQKIYEQFSLIINMIRKGDYHPNMICKGGIPVDFSSYPLTVFGSDYEQENYQSMSLLLENYYGKKNLVTRIHQKSVDLRKIIQTALEKDYKKYDIQEKQLSDTKKREKYQIYGELLTAYAYQIPAGQKETTVLNYYTNENIKIPLDPELSPMDNAKKYFDKYGKLKRTYEALHTIIVETKEEIQHLESLMNSLDIAVSEDDLKELKEELIQSGYIRRKSGDKKARYKSRPFHYLSSDGFHMYVGKNNLQNEELTFKTANGGDWWFHSKTFPGSHVIVKTEGKELPDKTFEEAARLAAYYSKGKDQEKVEIDYIERKHVKKVAGAKPGFVIYHTNYSMAIQPDITGIQEISNS